MPDPAGSNRPELAPRMHQNDVAKRARLRWRARRGLLENDLILQRFFAHHEHALTDDNVAGLDELLDLTDNELLDLILGRIRPDERLGASARGMLELLQSA